MTRGRGLNGARTPQARHGPAPDQVGTVEESARRALCAVQASYGIFLHTDAGDTTLARPYGSITGSVPCCWVTYGFQNLMGRRASICNGTHSLPQGWLQTASTTILPLVAMTRVPGWRPV